jgi:hypothetical protein
MKNDDDDDDDNTIELIYIYIIFSSFSPLSFVFLFYIAPIKGGGRGD